MSQPYHPDQHDSQSDGQPDAPPDDASYAEAPLRRVEAPRKPHQAKKRLTGGQLAMRILAPIFGIVLAIGAWNMWGGGKKRIAVTIGYPPVSLTLAQRKDAEALATTIAEALTTGNPDDAHKAMNWEAVKYRTEGPLALDVLPSAQFREVLQETFSSDSPGMFRIIMNDHRAVETQFLHLGKRDGYEVATFRCVPTEQRVEYYDLLVYPIKAQEGKLRVIDLYDYQTGLYHTDRLRWGGIQPSGVTSTDDEQWIAVFGTAARPYFLTLKQVISHDILGKGPQAYNMINEIQSPVRELPDVFALELRALRHCFDKEPTAERTERFVKLLQNPIGKGGNKPDGSTLLAEVYEKAGKTAESEAELDKAYSRMKDGYLKLQLAKNRFAKGDYPGAQQAFKVAQSLSPDIRNLFIWGKRIEEKMNLVK